jgi:hypothetical protein
MRRVVLTVAAVPLFLLSACGSSGPPTPSQCAQQVKAWLAGDDGWGFGTSVDHDISELVSDARVYLKAPNSIQAQKAEADISTMFVANPLPPKGGPYGLPNAPECADPTGGDVADLTGAAQNVYADQQDGGASATDAMQTILNDFSALNMDLNENANGMQIRVTS